MNMSSSMWMKIGLVACVYIISHCFRVVRLTLLTLENKVRFRHLFQTHFYTAALSRLLPFKLGELYRIIRFGDLLGKPINALVVVWIERLFDAITIAVLLAFIALFAPSLIMNFQTLILLLSIFVMVTMIMFFILPENLSTIKTMLIVRYNRPWLVSLLKFITLADQVVKLAPKILAKKLITLTIISMLIWCCEIVALGIILPGSIFANYSHALLALPDALTTNFYNYTTRLQHAGITIDYTFITLTALLFMGAGSFFFYYRSRKYE